jgi:pimeloyl-ACP methyl ester carboxylesterase
MSGTEDGAPLVLLPGLTASSLMWTPNVRALSESFRVVAIDAIYGWRKSVFTKLPKNTADLCAWLGEVLDGLGFAAVHFAGASYGGWVAAEFALQRPERLPRSPEALREHA